MGTHQTKSNPPKANIYLFTFPIPQSPEFCAPSQATFLWVWCGCWVRCFLLGPGPHPLTPDITGYSPLDAGKGRGRRPRPRDWRVRANHDGRRPTTTSLLRALLRSCPRLVGPPQSSSCAAGRPSRRPQSRVRRTGLPAPEALSRGFPPGPRRPQPRSPPS